jgi:serine/threonine protein kinase
VAIKRCYIEDQDIPHHAYILRELRIMGCLNHPNLIQLKEASLWSDYLWMSMELMSCSVFNLLYNTTVGLTEGNTVRVAKEVKQNIFNKKKKFFFLCQVTNLYIVFGRLSLSSFQKLYAS